MIIQKTELEAMLWDDWTDNFEVIERGDWVSEGKYECMMLIIRHKETLRYFRYPFLRSGSYFTEYYYTIDDESDEIELREVVMKEVVTTTWVTL
jgi:hypothetical protein